MIVVKTQYSVLHPELLCSRERVLGQFFSVKNMTTQTYTGDLTVFVSGVIVDAFACVTAGAILCFHVLVSGKNTSLCYRNRIQNVKHLTDRS